MAIRRIVPQLVVIAFVLIMSLPRLQFSQSNSYIEGVVLETGTERPLQFVKVTLNPGTTFARTDGEGHFRIDVANPGRYRIAPTLDGFVYSRPAHLQAIREPGVWLEATGVSPIRDIQLHMVKPGVITGRALLPNGEVMTNLSSSVNVLRYSYDEFGKRGLSHVPEIPSARMDDRGQFRIFGLPPGEYYLHVGHGSDSIFYPGVDDQTKSVPIAVRAGEEVSIPAMTMVLRGTRKLNLNLTFPNEVLTTAGATMQFRFPSVYGFGGYSAIRNNLRTPIPASEPLQADFLPEHYDLELGLKGIGLTDTFFYSLVTIEAGMNDVEKQVTFTRGVQVSGSLMIENAAGQRSNATGIRCILRPDSIGTTSAESTSLGCLEAQYSRGLYRLEMQGMPQDAYVISAEADGHDILTEGLQLDDDAEIHVLLGDSGGVIGGAVLDSNGNTLSDAIVALVPDAPLRAAGPLYRSVISDPNGNFELHGIGPGAYRLFAWAELEGAGYRNAEFMKEFEDRGKPIVIDKADRLSVNLTAF